jgi:hypothetical protein
MQGAGCVSRDKTRCIGTVVGKPESKRSLAGPRRGIQGGS